MDIVDVDVVDDDENDNEASISFSPMDVIFSKGVVFAVANEASESRLFPSFSCSEKLSPATVNSYRWNISIYFSFKFCSRGRR